MPTIESTNTGMEFKNRNINSLKSFGHQIYELEIEQLLSINIL